MKEIPVGSTWECRDKKRNMIGRITLFSREGRFEVWYYSRWFDDGSGYEVDWAPSYKKARELLLINGKLKRRNEANSG